MQQGVDSGIYYYLEVVTASQQIIPCLRLYTQWAKQDDISLSDAVDLFLSLSSAKVIGLMIIKSISFRVMVS